MTRRAVAAVAALVLAGASGLCGAAGSAASTGPVLAAHAAATGDDCAQVTSDPRDKRTVEGENSGQLDLQVPPAQALVSAPGRVPGAGVTVIVVDSGIDGLAEGPGVATGHALPELQTAHGMSVAGIIGGRDQPDPEVSVGFAPGAVLIDAPFYDAPYGEGDEGSTRPTAGALAAALQAVRPRVRPRTIVVVPTEVPPTPALKSAVSGLVARGALVVAAAGDRPGAEGGSPLDDYAGDQPKPGEDVAGEVAPASYDGVLAVGMSVADGRSLALRNSDVDVAAPGVGSVSVARDGGWCVLASPSTHWATAEVAGIAALVWSANPTESADRIRTRLESTASGNGRASSPVTGRGVVQPVEALQRRSATGEREMADAEVVERATPPPEQADVLAEARENAVWWGLAGGGALLVLLLARPVLARRRR